MTIIDGEKKAKKIRKNLKQEVKEMNIDPKLVTILMSNDPASETYVKMKHKASKKVGIKSEIREIDPEAPESKLLFKIEELNQDGEVNGILVQLPLPDHVSRNKVFKEISPLKDVDGLHPENMGLLVEGNPRIIPATPNGIQKLLIDEEIDIEGKHIVIISNSDILGKPLANLLFQDKEDANATVTVCHEKTKNLKKYTKTADILVTGVGKPKFITQEMIKQNSTIIDVGISRIKANNKKGYKIVGDADFKKIKNKAKAITPVPGGVGPMTVAMVLENTVEATKIQIN